MRSRLGIRASYQVTMAGLAATSPAVLTYRVIAFWLPVPPGVIAYFQLRRTVAGWEGERRRSAMGGYTSQSKVTAEATR